MNPSVDACVSFHDGVDDMTFVVESYASYPDGEECISLLGE